MLSKIAEGFAKHGAKAVILMSRNQEKITKAAAEVAKFGPSEGISGDVRKYEDCSKVVTYIVEKYGQLDVLVNGAAGNFLAQTESLSTNGFRTVLEIDTIGTFNMSKAAYVNAMKAKKQGVILNITAELHWNGSVFQAHSAAAKAGVDALTRVMACEWGPYGIRVNGLCPGAIEGTEGFARLGDVSLLNNKDASKQANAKTDHKATSEMMGKVIPQQRCGTADDIANGALYLCSPAAAYSTGSVLVIDGGAFLTYPNMLFGFPQFAQSWSDAKL